MLQYTFKTWSNHSQFVDAEDTADFIFILRKLQKEKKLHILTQQYVCITLSMYFKYLKLLTKKSLTYKF